MNEPSSPKPFINKIVPLVYDDSLSFYEFFNAVVKWVTDSVNSIVYDISSKLNKSVYEADKVSFETLIHKVNTIEPPSISWNNYPSTEAVTKYVSEKAITSDKIINSEGGASTSSVYSSAYVDSNFLNLSKSYEDFATEAKTIKGAIAELKARIGNPNVYLAEYDSTTFAELLGAYNDDRTIVLIKEVTSPIGANLNFFKLSRVIEASGAVAGFVFTDSFGASIYTATCYLSSGWSSSENVLISNLIEEYSEGEEVENLPYTAGVVYEKMETLNTSLTSHESHLSTIDATITGLNNFDASVNKRFAITPKIAIVERQVTFVEGEATITGVDVSPICSGNTFNGSVVANGLATGLCFASSILDATASASSIYLKCVSENYNGSLNVRIAYTSL